tara:strand:- start:1256 stop:1930 length:675 start_codon:yes stop_codon:yes gene_type:complete
MPKAQLINGEWMKVCCKPDCHMAGTPQPVERFSKRKAMADGLQYRCKECVKKYQQENRERTKQYNKERSKQYYSRPEVKERKRAYNKEYYRRPEVRKRNNQRRRERYNSDPAFRLKSNISHYVNEALRVRGKTKGGSTFDHLPYTPQDLKEHIEKQFDEHMTWENHGSYWHVDHIRPHASFNYDSLTHPDFQKCWALENLRPLEATKNRRKNSIYEGTRHYHKK